MKEWVWVIKKYTVPKEPVQHDLVGQWIYKCKKGSFKPAEEIKNEEIIDGPIKTETKN